MREKIIEYIKEAIDELQATGKWTKFDVPQIIVERPKDFSHGDWMTNISFLLSKKLQKNPKQIAEELKNSMLKLDMQFIDTVEVAGAGFVNIRVADQYLQFIVEQIIEKKELFGNSDLYKGKKINNEFISANPTGPLHLGNGRGGFFGDSLSRVLKKAGADVVNEYYINDAGEQIDKLGHSILKDGDAVYGGEYVNKLSEELNAEKDVEFDKSSAHVVGEWAAEQVVKRYLKPTISEMNISFDNWVSERKDIINKGFVDKAIKSLTEQKITFEKAGALWLKTTKYGDDKDRVLIKQDGQKTYFASDCGYILYKIERGFDEIIEIWGADHHGYIKRFEAAANALGFKGRIVFDIAQLVRLIENGKEVKMSKRAGNVVYVKDLIDAVGYDATRFFFLMQSLDSHMDFDLSLAKEKSQKNPVYYVQYAHARLISIIEKSMEMSFHHNNIDCKLAILTHEKEKELMRVLEMFSELIEDIATSHDVHKLTHYSISLADKFHSFYTTCKVVDKENVALSQARLQLVQATRVIISQALFLIGVEAPSNM